MAHTARPQITINYLPRNDNLGLTDHVILREQGQQTVYLDINVQKAQ